MESVVAASTIINCSTSCPSLVVVGMYKSKFCYAGSAEACRVQLSCSYSVQKEAYDEVDGYDMGKGFLMRLRRAYLVTSVI